MKIESGICPYCNSEKISYNEMQIYGEEIGYPCVCEGCKREWEEIYFLKFIGMETDEGFKEV